MDTYNLGPPRNALRPTETWQPLGKTLLKVKLLVGEPYKISRSTQRSVQGMSG